MKNLSFKNGDLLPIIGLGTWKSEPGQVRKAVFWAIEAGYRHVDCAAIYQNEREVGQGIADALAAGLVKREDIFVTSKLWNNSHRHEDVHVALEKTLSDLRLDYLDLYLIHWPVKGKYKDTWRALETLYNAGKIRAIGVSNFHVHHLQDLFQSSMIKPMINQVEFHPRLAQKELRAFCKEQGIQFEAWSPLMQGKLLDNPTLQRIAEKYSKSIAQVIIRWDLQNDVVTIPKSIKEHRIIENSNVFDFELTKEDMEQIDSLNQNQRVGSDPDNFNF